MKTRVVGGRFYKRMGRIMAHVLAGLMAIFAGLTFKATGGADLKYTIETGKIDLGRILETLGTQAVAELILGTLQAQAQKEIRDLAANEKRDLTPEEVSGIVSRIFSGVAGGVKVVNDPNALAALESIDPAIRESLGLRFLDGSTLHQVESVKVWVKD